MADQYVSNLTARLKTLEHPPSPPQSPPDADEKYKTYSVEHDARYVISRPQVTLPMPIPAYNQTPVQTPVQTPSLDLSLRNVSSTSVRNVKSRYETQSDKRGERNTPEDRDDKHEKLDAFYTPRSSMTSERELEHSKPENVSVGPSEHPEASEYTLDPSKLSKTPVLKSPVSASSEAPLEPAMGETPDADAEDQHQTVTAADINFDHIAQPEFTLQTGLLGDMEQVEDTPEDAIEDPRSKSPPISPIGHKKNRPLSSGSSKRLSAINFARNIINLSVYHDSDSDKEFENTEVAKRDHREARTILEVIEGPRPKREKSKRGKKNEKIKNDKNKNASEQNGHTEQEQNNGKKPKKKSKPEDHRNPELPTNFHSFVKKFILPNCEVVETFPVLEPKPVPQNGLTPVESPPEMITNGIAKPISNVKRLASFLRKNGRMPINFTRKFSKKGKPEKQALEVTSAMDVNDPKFMKNVYLLETEELVKMLKFWNYDYTLPSVDKMFPYLHNLELNDSQYAFFQDGLLVPENELHKSDLRVPETAQGSEPISAPQVASSSSKLVPLPNLDKYLMLINTNDFYEYDDSKDVQPGVLEDDALFAEFMSYVKRKYYLKGSVSPWEVLDFDEIQEEKLSKNKPSKSRVRFEGQAEEEEEEPVEQPPEKSGEDETLLGHKFVKLGSGDLTINNRKFTGGLKPLDLLQRMNRIKSLASGDTILAHKLYSKKINLRSYGFQILLLFKIAHVVVYNSDNNMSEARRFARIIGHIQKQIFLKEKERYDPGFFTGQSKQNSFQEGLCFILRYDVRALCDFDITRYSENENVILGIEKQGYETVDSRRARYADFKTKPELARFLSANNPFLVPYLSSVLKNNLTNWNRNYLLHEKFENWLITSGTEIYNNISVGNVIDYNNAVSRAKLQEKRAQYVRKLRGASPEMTYKLRGAIMALDEKMASNHGENTNYRVLINCKEGAEFPKPEIISSVYNDIDKLLEKPLDLVYLEFPSSGSFVLPSITDAHVTSIVNFLRLIHHVSSKYKVLIYCYDGFTHLSLLALLYEMMECFCTAACLVVKYYLIYERYLYWFKIDYEILDFMEKFAMFYSWKRSQPGLVDGVDYSAVREWYEGLYANIKVEVFDVIRAWKHLDWRQKRGGAVVRNEGVPAVTMDNPEKHSDLQGNQIRDQPLDWFSLLEDNNLPLRVLPYLYLGGINHLNLTTILELLSVNYVITIGEKPKWLNLTAHDNAFDHDSLDPVLKEKIGPQDIIEIENPLPFVKRLFYLPNVQDNGIDTFEPYILYLLKVIRRLREENQNLVEQGLAKSADTNRVLVNCKVGVSRSASLCIAEVMNFLKISLPRAYLYVRVRRLNLIIQPNLKIFYNLMELEEMLTIKENVKIRYINRKIEDYNKTHHVHHQVKEEQKKKKKKRELCLRKPKVLREVDWHILCREIEVLNAHYIKN